MEIRPIELITQDESKICISKCRKLPKSYSVIALSSMTKVRAAQLMKIRKKFHNDIKIKIIKNRVVQKSFEKINGIVGLDQLSSKLEGQCALMFTNISPFKLNLVFDQNKVYLVCKRRRCY